MLPERGVPIGWLAAVVGARLAGEPAVRVSDVTHDSRLAGPGSLFVAVPGLRVDGHRFVAQAAEGGASAACVERVVEAPLPQLVVEDARRALARLAAEVHGHPSRRMAVVGVTGTDGKTTVTHMLESVAAAAGIPAAVVGTIGARIAGRGEEIARTTPEASDLQRLFATMVERDVSLAAVEVSSHALTLGRVDWTWFEVSAFTNLSQDHLDFHGDLDSYFEAKASLFRPERTGRAVIWVDDPAGARLAESVALPVVRVSLSPGADVWAEDVSAAAEGSRFVLRAGEERRPIRLPVGGEFNVANALVTAGCALALSLPVDAIGEGLEGMSPVPGRFEPVDAGQAFAVIVDYAHTPRGIEVVVESARKMTRGRVMVVVGAGGDRDRAKRPLMGRAAAAADLVLVTSDNPRSEDPLRIIDEVSAGARLGTAEVIVEPDRRAAIGRAVRMAEPGDTVLILGKGHEQGQELADRVEPFDDRTVALEELERS